MDCIAHIETCPKCGRKILISRILVGVDHVSGTGIICLECLPEEKRKEVIERYSTPNYVPQDR